MLALFLGLEVMMNHVQVTYYLAILLVLFALAEGVRAVREKTLVGLREALRPRRGGGGAWPWLCNIGVLWSTLEYGKYTTRGASELTMQADGTSAEGQHTGGLNRDYVTQYSYGKQESFTFLVPDAKGGDTSALGNGPELEGADPRFRQNLAQMNRYWGDQLSTAGPQYAGVIVALLMILMLMQAEGKGRWWLLASFALILLQIMISNAAPYSDDGVGYIGGMKASLLAGAVLIAYLAVGLVLLRDGLVYALFSAVLITLLLSWGRNLMPLTDFFLEYVPGYNKFRAVTIILVIVELAAPVLGILYLDRLINEGGWNKLVESRSLIGMGAVLGVLFVMAVMPDSILSFVSDQEREMLTQQAEDSAERSHGDVLRGGIEESAHRHVPCGCDAQLRLRPGAGVLVFLFGRKKIGKAVLLGGIGALILLDQWTVDKRYMNNERERGRYVHWVDDALQQNPYTANAADKAILEAEWTPAAQADHEVNMARMKEERQKEGGLNKIIKPEEEITARFASLRRHGGYRVLGLNNPFNDTRISYFHRSLGGYHGAKLKRYQELIEFQISPAMQRIGSMLQSGTSLPVMDSLLANEGVLNMLNTRYLIYNPERPPIRNTNAYGPAWFVDEVQWAKNADDEIIQLGTIDPSRTAVIDERYRGTIGDGDRCTRPICQRGTHQLRHQRTHLHRAQSARRCGGVQRDLVRTGLACHHRQRPHRTRPRGLRPPCYGRTRRRTHGGLQDRQQAVQYLAPRCLGKQCLGAVVSDGCIVLGVAEPEV